MIGLPSLCYRPPLISDTIVLLGRNSRTGATVYDTTPHATSASILSGNSAGHFDISSTGKITVASAGQNNLLSTYTLVVQATDPHGTDTATLIINTEANALDVTTGAELIAACTYCETTNPSTDWKVYIKDGYDIQDNAGSVRVIISGVSFNGTLTDNNEGKTIADFEAGGYDRNATANITGGSVTITCRTQYAGKISCQLELIGSRAYCFRNLWIDRRDLGFDGGRTSACIQVTNNGTFTDIPLVVFADCKFGDPTKPKYLWTGSMTTSPCDTAVVEDCLFDGVWSAVAASILYRTVMRRCIFKQRIEDCYRGFGITSLLPGMTYKRTEITDCVMVPIQNDGMTPFELVQHSDCIQFNTAADVGDYEHYIKWNYLASRQGIFSEGSAAGVTHRGVMSRNFIMAASPNGMVVTKNTPPDTFVNEYNTIVKDTLLTDTGGNGNCRLIINAGDNQTVRNNIVAALVDATGPQTLYTSDASFPNPMQDGVSVCVPTGNVYVDHRTQNTGANTSYPEWFDGPFVWEGVLPGFGQTYWQMRAYDPETFVEDADIIFNPKAGGPAVGKGHLAP